jgi:hypothetical protein
VPVTARRATSITRKHDILHAASRIEVRGDEQGGAHAPPRAVSGALTGNVWSGPVGPVPETGLDRPCQQPDREGALGGSGDPPRAGVALPAMPAKDAPGTACRETRQPQTDQPLWIVALTSKTTSPSSPTPPPAPAAPLRI